MPAATWVVLQRERVPGILSWCLGGVLAGLATNLIVFAAALPPWVTWAAVFLVIPAANLLRIQSMLQFEGRSLPWYGWVLALLLATGFGWAAGTDYALLGFGFHILLYLAVGSASCWVGQRSGNGSAYWIGGFFFLIAGLMVAHKLSIPSEGAPEIFQSSVWAIALVAVAACGALATYIGYTGLVLEQVSKQRVAAEADARSRAATVRLSQQLAQMQRREMVGQMSAYIAHEVSQPLGALLLNSRTAASLIASGTDPGQGLEMIGRVTREAERLREVVNRVRRLARSEAPQVQWMNLGSAVDDVTTLVAAEALTREVVLTFDRNADTLMIEADPVQVVQVLLNVVRNGIDAAAEFESPRWVRISLGLDQQGAENQAWVRVEDSGIGFSESDLKMAGFDMYTTKQDGLGLGLSISRQIAMLHHGRLDWRNGEAGAIVELRLPVVQPRHDPFAT